MTDNGREKFHINKVKIKDDKGLGNFDRLLQINSFKKAFTFKNIDDWDNN